MWWCPEVTTAPERVSFSWTPKWKKTKKNISKHIILCSLENILLLKASKGSYQTADESSCPTIYILQHLNRYTKTLNLLMSEVGTYCEQIHVWDFTHAILLSQQDFIVFRRLCLCWKQLLQTAEGMSSDDVSMKKKTHLRSDNCCPFSEQIWGGPIPLHAWILIICIPIQSSTRGDSWARQVQQWAEFIFTFATLSLSMLSCHVRFVWRP